MWVQSLALLSGWGIWRCQELWCRLQTQLRSRIAVAVAVAVATAAALIRPPAWKLPKASGVALKSKKTNKRKRKRPVHLEYPSLTPANPLLPDLPGPPINLFHNLILVLMHTDSYFLL